MCGIFCLVSDCDEYCAEEFVSLNINYSSAVHINKVFNFIQNQKHVEKLLKNRGVNANKTIYKHQILFNAAVLWQQIAHQLLIQSTALGTGLNSSHIFL